MYRNFRNGATPSFFHKCATPCPFRAVPAVKTPVGAVAKNTYICFSGEWSQGVAHLWKNEGVAPLRELLYLFLIKDEENQKNKDNASC